MILVDADVLGRNRTGDETYVRELLRALPEVAHDLRFAALTRDPSVVPDGIEPIVLQARPGGRGSDAIFAPDPAAAGADSPGWAQKAMTMRPRVPPAASIS